MLMVENNGDALCIFADEIIGEQEVVIKALPGYIRNLKKVRGLSGCTLLGDSSISLILDVGDLTAELKRREDENVIDLIAESLETSEDTQKGKFLTFLLGNEAYAIEIKFVIEMIGMQPITKVPELPEYVRG